MKISFLRVAGLMVVLGAALMYAQAGPLHAQAGPPADGGMGKPPMDGMRGGPPTPAMQLQRLTRQLALSDAQQAAILPILQDRQTKMAALRKDGSETASREAGMQQARVILDASNAQIRALLTAVQAAKFDMMQPKGPMGGGQQVPPSDGSGQPPDPK